VRMRDAINRTGGPPEFHAHGCLIPAYLDLSGSRDALQYYDCLAKFKFRTS
jgi:hypothetical protein